MTVRRPIGNWAQEDMGTVVDPNDGSVGIYALLNEHVVAWLVPNGDGAWQATGVPRRAQVVIAGRYPERDLTFHPDPVQLVRRGDPEEPVQWLDPARLNLVYTGNRLQRLLDRKGDTIRGDWDQSVAEQPFGESPEFAAYATRAGGARWASIDLPEGMPSDRAALRAFDGYLKRFKAGAGPEDAAAVAIGRTGRYILLDGAAQLAAARLAQIPELPVRVVARHPDWEALREEVIDVAGRHKGRVYQPIRHPDLADLRSSQDADRVETVQSAFAGYDTTGKRLMDIGAQWGMMSRAMEDIGFDVTAVEANPHSASMAERLRDATESRYAVWHGSVFEFPEVEQQHAIIGMNIFHHFLKTEEMHNGLVSVLNRARGNVEIVVFSAHVFERRGPDMRNAFRDYPPQEFAEFVAAESGLPTIELIGKSHDGRSIFKLSR